MSNLSTYIQGEMDILFFAPEKKDLVRAVNEMVGVDVDEVEETAAVASAPLFTGLCSPKAATFVDEPRASLNLESPENAQLETSIQASTQATPSRSSVPTTPSRWNVKDLNFESAGFTPDESAAIKRKIEAQKLIDALTSDVKQGLISTPASKSTPRSMATPNSTLATSNGSPTFILKGTTHDNDATIMKRKMKLQSLVDALSNEQLDDTKLTNFASEQGIVSTSPLSSSPVTKNLPVTPRNIEIQKLIADLTAEVKQGR